MKEIYSYKVSLILFFLFTMLSCERSIDFVDYEPQIVVEGRIENGQYASVLLSTSVSFTEDLDQSNLLSHAIRTAKVVVSDGEQSEILRLTTNEDKMPPFEYVTMNMKGEIGKTYTLTIYYKDKEITAETYIPQPVSIESLSFIRNNTADTVGYIKVGFNNVSDHNYQVSTRLVGVEDVYHPTLYGNIDRALYEAGKLINIQVSKSPIIYPVANYATAFPDSVPIEVKLSTQTQDSFDFWVSYQNEILNSQNPIYPSTSRLKSNIKGGVGIWAGYGVDIELVDPQKVK